MDDIDQLYEALSGARMVFYLEACAGDRMAALRLHCWNTEVSEAFYGPLQYFEIGLRNALHGHLAKDLGREDWWNAPDATLHPEGVLLIEKCHRKIGNHMATPAPDRVVAELPLGFWVGLLGRGKSYDEQLWRRCLHRAFPGFRGVRRDLYRSLDHARAFRNRIAHHEPVYYRDLDADHRSILRLIDYLSPSLSAQVAKYSRVPEVLARRPPTTRRPPTKGKRAPRPRNGRLSHAVPALRPLLRRRTFSDTRGRFTCSTLLRSTRAPVK